MNAILARVKIRDGKEEEALAELQKMADGVQTREPDALAYAVHRSVDDPSQVLFFEMYADDEAFKAHAQTPHMGDFRGAFAEIFDASQTKIERLERIGGFIRAEAS